VLAPSPGSSAQWRVDALARLRAHTVDFLVSDRDMRPVAVVQVAAAHANAATAGSPESSLDAVGVRYIELDPAALPRKDAMRAIVLGDDTGGRARAIGRGIARNLNIRRAFFARIAVRQMQARFRLTACRSAYTVAPCLVLSSREC
jgi:hypothetical protein